MGWLRRILGFRDQGRTDKLRSSGVDSDSNEIRLQDDNTYQKNVDVIDGLEFAATLHLRTPLAVLEHHGEVFKGPPSEAPRYGSEAEGSWTYKTKSWAELGFDLQELPKSRHASDIGTIKPSEYLPFLKAFRRIVEADVTHEEKLRNLMTLQRASTSFADIWKRLEKAYEDFPSSFFYLRLTELPGIGRKTATSLYAAGFWSVEDVLHASREDLLAVSGMGKATVNKIDALRKLASENNNRV